MKTLFVVLPQGIEKAQEAIEQIALAASTQLGMYLSIFGNANSYGWGLYFDDDDPHNTLHYIASSIYSMDKADYVAFTPDWQKYQECRVLHEIAEQYKLDIIECEVQSEEPELKACPFCKDSEMLVCTCEDKGHGKEYSVFCRTCETSGPVAHSESDAVELWNGWNGR